MLWADPANLRLLNLNVRTLTSGSTYHFDLYFFKLLFIRLYEYCLTLTQP